MLQQAEQRPELDSDRKTSLFLATMVYQFEAAKIY